MFKIYSIISKILFLPMQKHGHFRKEAHGIHARLVLSSMNQFG